MIAFPRSAVLMRRLTVVLFQMNEGTLMKLIEEVNRQYDPPPKTSLSFQRGKSGTRDTYNSDDDSD